MLNGLEEESVMIVVPKKQKRVTLVSACGAGKNILKDPTSHQLTGVVEPPVINVLVIDPNKNSLKP